MCQVELKNGASPGSHLTPADLSAWRSSLPPTSGRRMRGGRPHAQSRGRPSRRGSSELRALERVAAGCGVALGRWVPEHKAAGQPSATHRATGRGVAGPPDLRGWPGARVKRLRLSRLRDAGGERLGKMRRERIQGEGTQEKNRHGEHIT